MRLGTSIPDDQPAQVDGVFDLDKALGCLAENEIQGCLTNFPGDEAVWEAYSQRLARALRASGVVLLEYNAPFFIPVITRETCALIADKTVRILAIAENTGCLNVATCVAGPGGTYPHPENRTQKAWDILKETCDLVADGAGKLGLRARLLIEPVYTTVVRSPLELARIIDEVDSPNVRGHMDIANCLSFDIIFEHAQFIRDGFETLENRINSAHIKDVAPAKSYMPGLVETQVGEGAMDLRTYMACLSRMPADFPVVIEHLSMMADIRRSYQRILAIASEIQIKTWSE